MTTRDSVQGKADDCISGWLIARAQDEMGRRQTLRGDNTEISLQRLTGKDSPRQFRRLRRLELEEAPVRFANMCDDTHVGSLLII